jgi:hypothetical protein
VLIRESIADTGVDLLRERYDVVLDADSPIEEIIGGFEGIVIRSATKLTAELIERAERLKVIGRAAPAWASTTSTWRPRRGAASSWRTRRSRPSSRRRSTRSACSSRSRGTSRRRTLR